MKRFLINILFFFMLVAAADFVYGRICDYFINHAHSGDTARSSAIFKNNKYDVMIMGSSRCVCHYDDQLMSDSLKVDVINAGKKGNGIVLMYGLYHIIPKENKPQVLIYDLEPAFDVIAYKNDDHNKRYLSGLKNYYEKPGVKEIFQSVDRQEVLKMFSNFYRYNSLLLPLIKDYMGKPITTASCYEPSHKAWTKPKNPGGEPYRNIDELKLKYFEKLINETKEDGVRLIVIASPKYGETSTEEISPVIELCQKHGVPFWNYYLSMQDTQWFCNRMHLNYNGSQVFTDIISHRIKNEILN